ncbi:hypothetical protein [Variovorax gossypii]
MACEKFGQALVDSFPRFAHGPRKGKLKGYLCYIKATVGGWAHNLPNGAGVLFPGAHHWKLAMVTQYSDPKEQLTVARWHPETGVSVLQAPQTAWKLLKAIERRAPYTELQAIVHESRAESAPCSHRLHVID